MISITFQQIFYSLCIALCNVIFTILRLNQEDRITEMVDVPLNEVCTHITLMMSLSRLTENKLSYLASFFLSFDKCSSNFLFFDILR